MTCLFWLLGGMQALFALSVSLLALAASSLGLPYCPKRHSLGSILDFLLILWFKVLNCRMQSHLFAWMEIKHGQE